MSIQALNAVLSHKFGSTANKTVMMILADRADEEWSCYPGQERIASDGEMGVRTVRRSLADLEDAGVIVRIRRDFGGHRTSDRYILDQDVIESLPATMSGMKSGSAVKPTGQIGTFQPATAARESSVEPTGVSALLLEDDSLELQLPKTSLKTRSESALFEDFWTAYPRKTGKEVAKRSWVKAVKVVAPEVMIVAAQAMAVWPDLPEKKFVCHPATWLNQHRWSDDLAEEYPPLKAKGVDWDEVLRQADEVDAVMGLKR